MKLRKKLVGSCWWLLLSLLAATSLSPAISQQATASKGTKVNFEFQEVVEIAKPCPKGENCLLSPYLSVAVFVDREREGRKTAVLLEDYFYCHPSSGDVFRTPAGFETDFLSIPGLLTGAVRSRDFMEAAVVHDWLYAVGEKGRRKNADQILADVLKEQGASEVVRGAMHKAVEFGGEKAYGSPDEWRFIDLETMERLNPAPFKRPDKAAIGTLSCSDKKEFSEFRKRNKTGLQYELAAPKANAPQGFSAIK